MARIYVAGPLFTPQDRQAVEAVAHVIRSLGHKAVIPHQEVRLGPVADASEARDRYRRLVGLLDGCDAVVALLDGVDVDGGTCFEIGYAAAVNRPVLGLRSDFRSSGESSGVNLMVAGSVGDVTRVAAWNAESLQRPVSEFVSSVRVLAGRLVRDAVPKLARDQGHEVAFDRVDQNAYPRVVKRRLAEVARRLESDEFGLEQEHVADLLELVEALIHARKYDRESLKAIKEGAWRKRGGYEQGFVVDEEPKLS